MVRLQIVEKAIRKLRRALKDFPAAPRVEEVHELRLRVRRAESVVATLDHGDKLSGLLMRMADVRKAAGHVRDMDVLESKALTLSSKKNVDAAVWLIESLGQARMKNADKLTNLIEHHRSPLRRGLKNCLRLMAGGSASHVRASADEYLQSFVSTNAHRAALTLVDEMIHWPEFDSDNLHDFRLCVKELRTLLELNPPFHAELVKALGDLKDSIGEWHDWRELSRIAGDVLKGKSDRMFLTQVDQMRDKQFRDSLAL